MEKTRGIGVLLAIAASVAFLSAGAAVQSPGESVTVKQVGSFVYCSLPQKGSFSEIQNAIGKLLQNMRSQNVFPTGPMLGIYHNSPDQVKPEELSWEVGFPVNDQAMVQAPLEKKQWTDLTVAAALHVGAYEKTAETITEIYAWMAANGYVQTGPLVERYLDMNPMQMKPEDLRTEIWIPCAKKSN